MTKVTLSLHTWVAACVNKLQHAYAGTFLRTQLRFQKHKKGKFFAIIVEIWNETDIV